MRDMT